VAIAARLMSLVLKVQPQDVAISFVRSEILDVETSKNSMVALNGILYDPAPVVLESVLEEILDLSLNSAQSTDVSSAI
jgi:hypothetical protein